MKHVFEQRDFGGTKTVDAGDEVIIELLEPATSGYRWEMVGEPAEAVGPVHSEYVPPQTEAGGAAGLRRFRLLPMRKSQIRLSFRMVSAFLKNLPPAAWGTIELEVRT